MVVLGLLIFLFVNGWSQVTSVVCKHGGTKHNATSCDCTGTCFNGATCHLHSRCGVIPTVNNSQQNVHVSLTSCDVTVTYTCDVGYNYTSANVTSSVTCNSTSWSGEPEYCHRIICPHPVFASATGPSKRVEHVFGDILQFDCDEFHSDKGGVFSITCLEDGTWSGGPQLCKARITAGMVIGLSLTACCVLLLALLPYDFFNYHKRQVTRKRHTRLHRVGVAHATPSPGVSPYLSPKTPGRATASASSRPYSLLLSEEGRLQVCEQLRGLGAPLEEQLSAQEDSRSSWGEEEEGEIIVKAVASATQATTGSQNKGVVVDPAHKPLVFPSERHMSFIDDDDDDD